MAGKKNRIVQPGDGQTVQLGLFSAANTGDSRFIEDYPPVYRDEEGFRRVLAGATDMLGLDFEFNTKTLKPTVIGIANYEECAAVWYRPELAAEMEAERIRRGFIYSGHAVLTADRAVLEAQVGYTTPLSAWSDSMLTFWLANSDLCKNPGKETDEEGGLGFMGLGTMVSLTTDLPHHKTCRGRNCEELICPRHDVRGYCAIDAYGGLLGDRKCREDLRRRGVPESSITFLHELTELSQRMSQMGVGVDHEYVETLAASMLTDQQKLFPGEGEEGFVFNPRSAKAVTEWGRENKVFFPSTDKGDVQTVLEKLAYEAGFSGEKFDEIQKALAAAEDDGKLDPVLSTVYKLYTYKILGKGTDPWFHPRYFGTDGRLHPRFVTTGTSTGRFSSSTPNCQNIPKRGWGKRVRKAFVPRDKNHVIVEADFSQLELRICLYLAGVDQKIIGADAFSWLVEKSGGLFEKAAQRYGGKPRDIAKSISHAADYLEGLRLYNATELDYARTRSEIESGALRVYHPKYMPDLREPWTFRGKIVGFTGGNLAQRLFGSKSFENRRKALEIQEDIYFAAFPQIRHWQQKVLREVENRGYVSSPAGRFLRLNDTPEKDAKVAIAFLGQGVGASHVQSVMLEYWRRHRQVFFAQIHDALCGEFSLSGGYRPIYTRMKEMEMETDLLPGFTCPCKVEVGTDLGSMKELEEREGQLYLGGEPVE